MSDSTPRVSYADSLLAYADSLPIKHKRLLDSHSDQQFNDAFANIVLEAVDKLERNRTLYSVLCEDALSSIFVDAINATDALVVTREEFTNGHVDLTFCANRCVPARRVLGEAKIYRSFRWHKKGVDQLVGRYATGREGRGLLLVYVKEGQVKLRMERFRKRMDSSLPCAQTKPCSNHTANWSFVSEHRHSSGENLEVWHLGCNLEKAPAVTKAAK